MKFLDASFRLSRLLYYTECQFCGMLPCFWYVVVDISQQLVENIRCRLQHLSFYLIASCTSIISQWLFLPQLMAGSSLLAVNGFCLVLSVFLRNCFLKCAAIILACSFLLMVNPPVSVLIRSGIFGFWRWISFITRNILQESFLLFSISLRQFSNFCSSSFFIFRWIVFMISLRSLRRLFFVVLLVTFSIFSLISCCCLDSRAISSSTWKRCFGFFPMKIIRPHNPALHCNP